jgi:hypothetical protein
MPSSPELGFLLFGVFAVFFLGTGVLLGYWTYLDARARDSDSAIMLGIAVGVVGWLVFPYLYFRGERVHPKTRRERIVATVVVANVVAVLIGTMVGPPDPFSGPLYVLGALVVTLPLAYLVVYRE